MGEPPVFVGAVKEIDALASPAEATTFVGAPGTVAGITELDGDDCDEVPIPFVAFTLKVYASPFDSPVISSFGCKIAAYYSTICKSCSLFIWMEYFC